MTVIVCVELTCDRCERTTDRHLHERVSSVTAEEFVRRVFHGWNIDPHGVTRCPECVQARADLARQITRRAERSARDQARARGELPPMPGLIRVRRDRPNTGTPK